MTLAMRPASAVPASAEPVEELRCAAVRDVDEFRAGGLKTRDKVAYSLLAAAGVSLAIAMFGVR